MDTQPAIEFNDVCFSYKNAETLHNVCLEIPQKSLVAVVGPNGGGKSTLLKLTLGLLKPNRGQVRVLGQTPVAARRRVGYVPQQMQFDPAFPVTVADVVQMGRVERHWAGPARRSDRKAVSYAIDRVGLTPLRNRGFAELSGGERQRVLIAQALATEPEILLLDEPTANVDAVVEQLLYEILKQLNERLSIVVVSHNLNVVTSHASHVVCVNRTASMGSIDALTPQNIQDAFASEMTVLRHHDDCHVFDPSSALSTPHKASHADGKET